MNLQQTRLVAMLIVVLCGLSARAQQHFFYSDILNDESLSHAERIEQIDSIFNSDTIYVQDSTYGLKFYTRWKNRIQPLLNASGNLDSYVSFLRNGYDDTPALLSTPEASNSGGSVSMSTITTYHDEANWKSIGPEELVPGVLRNNNNIQSIGKMDVVRPFNTNIIYAASDKGGLFKTTDGGQNWKAVPITLKKNVLGVDVTLFPPQIGVNTIAVHPTNADIVYASVSYAKDYGIGTFKTIDGGETWVHQYEIGPTVANKNYIFRKIVIDPANTDHLYAITAAGVFETDNGGGTSPGSNSWVPISDPDGLFHRANLLDLEIDPNNSDIIYVSGKSIWKIDLTSGSPVIEDYRMKLPVPGLNDFSQHSCAAPLFHNGVMSSCTVVDDITEHGLWKGDITAYIAGNNTLGSLWRNYCDNSTIKTGVIPPVNGYAEMQTKEGRLGWHTGALTQIWRSGQKFRVQFLGLDVPNGTSLEVQVKNTETGETQTIYNSLVNTLDADGFVLFGNQSEFVFSKNFNQVSIRANGLSNYQGNDPVSLTHMQIHIPEHLRNILIDMGKEDELLYAWATRDVTGNSRNYLLRSNSTHSTFDVMINDGLVEDGVMDAFVVTESPLSGNGIELFTGSIDIRKYHINMNDLGDPLETYWTTLDYPTIGGVLHDDYRDFFLLEAEPEDILYVAHDGGLMTMNPNETFAMGSLLTDYASIVGKGLTLGHFWSIDRERHGNLSLMGGGVMHQGAFFKDESDLNWRNNMWTYGDGADCEIHTDWDADNNRNCVMGFFPNLRISINDDNGEVGDTDTTTRRTNSRFAGWPSTYHFLEQAPNGDYYASFMNSLWISADDGVSWPLHHRFTHTYNGQAFNHMVIQSTTISPSDPDVMYIAMREPHWGQLDRGPRLYRRVKVNGVLTWEAMPLLKDKTIKDPNGNEIDDPTYGQGISDIAVSYTDPNVLWLVLDGVGGKRVYRSENAATANVNDIKYYDVTPALLQGDFSATVVATLPNTENEVFVGTDYGLFYAHREHSTDPWNWTRYSKVKNTVDWAIGGPHNNLPLGKIADIKIDERDNKILTSVYGRGIWESDLPCADKDVSNTDYVLTQTWADLTMMIDHDIVVGNGRTLTIDNCDLSFAQDVRIKVENGGKLIINNSILSNSCSKEWDGIFVEGKGLGNPQLGGGEVHMNNSTLENGEYGIRVGDSDNNSGGFVYVYDSEFRNCYVGISYYRYSYLQNNIIGEIKRSKFYCDAPIPGHGGKGVHAHIGLYAVRGLQIQGCSFYNYMKQDDIVDENKGIGIDVWDGSFILKRETDPVSCLGMGSRNYFEGLDYGIKLHGGAVQAGYNTIIQESEFKNNRIGISALYQDQPIIRDVKLEWGIGEIQGQFDPIIPTLNTSTSLCEGIILDHCPGFEVVDNEVNFQSDEFNFVGIRSNESVSSSSPILTSKIQNNAFDLLAGNKDDIENLTPTDYVATIFDGNNSDLYVSCNSYQNYFTDWIVNNQLAKQEGEPGLNLDPLNTFSSPCWNVSPGSNGSSFNNIYVDPFQIGGVEYAVDPGALLPACIDGVVNFVVGAGSYGGCATDVYTQADMHDCGSQGGGEQMLENTDETLDDHLIEDETSGLMSVYPNPSKGDVKVVLNKGLRINKIEVYSLAGQQVYSKEVSNTVVIHQLSLYGLKEGAYLLKAHSEGETYNQKIVIQ